MRLFSISEIINSFDTVSFVFLFVGVSFSMISNMGADVAIAGVIVFTFDAFEILWLFEIL